jgi:nicotinamide-nucleotide amidase
MRVELVTIGDELLLGFTVDTNGAHAGRVLAAEGIEIVRRTAIGDDADDIVAAVRDALERTGAVITTGGLGPTADDRSKEAIASLFGRGLTKDMAIVESLRARWKARGWPGELPVANEQQAMIPDGATILTNRHGSAPGIWLEDERGRWVAMLPGVPREMRGMLADELLPRIVARRTGNPTVIASRTLRTTGIAESAVADKLGPLARGFPGLSLAYLPGWEGVDLRITSRGLPAADASMAMEQAIAQLREIVGPWVYGEGNDDLAELVLDLARAARLPIVVAESCTGGGLGARLTAIPGSSDIVIGGIIAYDNRIKIEQLGVPEATIIAHGAVSEETVKAMAVGARERLKAGAAMSISGVAGPGGGTPEKPVGTVWLGIATPTTVASWRLSSVGDRAEVRQRAAQGALDLFRRTVAKAP